MTRPARHAAEVVAFWRQARDDWFSKSPAFDRRFANRFHYLHFAAAGGAFAGWTATPQGALALMILLDQYPRNAFRGTGHMYATDGLCRAYAREAMARDAIASIEPDMRLFLALPFAHSESLADQDVSVELNARLGEPWHAHALGHRDIIRRFGRFPHRNAILGRMSTPEETLFLEDGGFAG